MAAASQAFSGNLKKALAGLRRINFVGLRWRLFDAKGQIRYLPQMAYLKTEKEWNSSSAENDKRKPGLRMKGSLPFQPMEEAGRTSMYCGANGGIL